MKRSISLGLALAALMAAAPAGAASLDEMEMVAVEDMDRLRGGTETIPDVSQGNVSQTEQTNVSGPISVSGHSAKINGDIGTASISGTHGIVSQMINSGDNNILNSGTNINIYMK